MSERQRGIFEGHATVLQAALDDPGDNHVYEADWDNERGMVVYREVTVVADVLEVEGEVGASGMDASVGAWIDVEELRGREGNVNVRLNNGRTVVIGQGELTHLVKLAGQQEYRRRGDEVFVPANWLVGERVGY